MEGINIILFGARLSPAWIMVAYIVSIGLGIFSFFVARGLWKARQWARIAAIIFACLGILHAIPSMIQFGIVGDIGLVITLVVSLVINLVIVGYLIFSKDVKKAFA